MNEPGRPPRVLQTRVSRRRLLAASGAAAAGVAAGAGAGCGGRAPNWARPTPVVKPRRGGTLRTGTALPLSYGLDPHAEQGMGLAVFPRVFGYLMHVDPADDSVRFDQAEYLEQPDETTYVFRLRQGVRFQDVPPVNGRALVAEDVARSVERYRDHPLSVNKTWQRTVMSGIHAIDERLLYATTLRPYVYSLNELGGVSSGAIVPRELSGPGVDFNTQGAGSGPFRIGDVADARVRIERHGGYFNAPLPYLDAMEWRIFGDAASQWAAFRGGEFDVVAAASRAEIEALGETADEVETARVPGLAYLSIGFRVDRPPFNDERVREAIDITLDRTALIRELTLGEGDMTGPVNPHLAGGYWSLPREDVVDAFRGLDPIAERRADAKAMVERAGAAGAVVRLQVADVPALLDVAQAVGAQLREIGLSAEVRAVDRLTWFSNYRRGAFEATLISQPPSEWPDMPLRLYHSTGIDATGNAFGFSDKAIDALIERSWGETDRAARQRTVLEAQRLMVKARPLVHLYTSSSYTAARRRVRGWHPELLGSMAQYDYGQWLADGA